MTPIALTVLIFALMLALMALRVPIAVSMFAAGSVGYVLKAGWSPLASFLNTAGLRALRQLRPVA